VLLSGRLVGRAAGVSGVTLGSAGAGWFGSALGTGALPMAAAELGLAPHAGSIRSALRQAIGAP